MLRGQKLAGLEAAARFNRQMTWDLLSCANNLLIRAKSVRCSEQSANR
jgi:hypothetical protein